MFMSTSLSDPALNLPEPKPPARKQMIKHEFIEKPDATSPPMLAQLSSTSPPPYPSASERYSEAAKILNHAEKQQKKGLIKRCFYKIIGMLFPRPLQEEYELVPLWTHEETQTKMYKCVIFWAINSNAHDQHHW
ncbi:hypothetical protein B0H13DRAFT_2321330 [Mycena leptocephala]|nr:hypothetical protein B0H13DRAFT_2321330 [Mycena leptocephala]